MHQIVELPFFFRFLRLKVVHISATRDTSVNHGVSRVQFFFNHSWYEVF